MLGPTVPSVKESLLASMDAAAPVLRRNEKRKGGDRVMLGYVVGTQSVVIGAEMGESFYGCVVLTCTPCKLLNQRRLYFVGSGDSERARGSDRADRHHNVRPNLQLTLSLTTKNA